MCMCIYTAICYGRLGRLFFKQEKFDRAIVEYDRQLSLAIECGDETESAEVPYS